MATITNRVLVVEDDVDVGEHVQDTIQLVKPDTTVDVYPEALKALEAMTHQTYDLIITDLRMPGIDGIQLMAYIRANRLNRQTPLIVYSGHVDSATACTLGHYNVQFAVEKTEGVDALRQRLVQFFATRDRQARYSPEIVEVFQRSFGMVCRSLYETTADFRPQRLRNQADGFGADRTALIPIFGEQVYGSLAASLPSGYLASKARQLFGQVEVGFREVVELDLVSEFINQVGGELKRHLDKAGIRIQLGLPEPQAGATGPTIHKVPGSIVVLPAGLGQAEGFFEFCLGQFGSGAGNIPVFMSSSS